MKKQLEDTEELVSDPQGGVVASVPRLTNNFHREDLNEMRDVVNELYELKTK